MKQSNVQKDSEAPGFQLGAVESEQANHQQLINMPIGPPGDIIARLTSQQFMLPRNSENPNAGPSTQMSQNSGTPYG